MNPYKHLCNILFSIYRKCIDFTLIFFITMFLLSGCAYGPEPINLSTDTCDYCSMAISNPVFATEIITSQGEVLKFDDLHCLRAFKKEGESMMEGEKIFLINYLEPHNFIPAEEAFLLQSEKLHAPMGGNTAAFETLKELIIIQEKMGGIQMSINKFLESKK